MKRLSPAFLTFGMLGVVALLVTGYFAKKLLAVAPPPADPVVNVPMAVQNLTPGTLITEAHIGMGPAPRNSLSKDVVIAQRILIGRVVKNPIEASTPISTLDLYGPGERPAPDLEPGMRAVTVPLSADTVAAPGQFVDVHFTPSSDPESADTGGRIMTLFKGIKLLSIEGGSASTVRNAANVTLELTPEQANIILLAKDRGDLNLVYTPEGRGSGGVAVNDADRATLYEILGYTPRPETPPTPPFQTDVFRGSGHAIHRFKDGRYYDASDAGWNSPEPGNDSRNGPTAANDNGFGAGQADDREALSR